MATRHTLRPGERISRRKDFDRVFREGERRTGRLATVRCVPNGLGHSRLGIALSRQWRGAVARSRAKRIVREAFRTHKDCLPRGVDVIVTPRPQWGSPSAAAVARELIRLLAQSPEPTA